MPPFDNKIRDESGVPITTEIGVTAPLLIESAASYLTDGFGKAWFDFESGGTEISAASIMDFGQRIRAALSDIGPGDPEDTTGAANFIKDYGADGTGVADCLLAMNAAIADLNALLIKALYIPPGLFKFSDVPNPITAGNFCIYGNGTATRLSFKATAAHGTFFTIGVVDGSRGVSYFDIRDVMVINNASQRDRGGFYHANVSTNEFTTSDAALFHVDDPIRFLGSNLPGGIALNHTYYVLTVDSLTPGQVITICDTAPGSGEKDITGTGPFYGQIIKQDTTGIGGTNIPPANEPVIALNMGGQGTIRNIMTQNIGSLIRVGSHVKPSGKITAVDATANEITLDSNQTYLDTDGVTNIRFPNTGLAVGDTVTFTGTPPTGVTASHGYVVKTKTSLPGPNNPPNIITLWNDAHTAELDFSGTQIGANYTGDTYNARVQRYAVDSVMGTWNVGTPAPDRIDILNGTSGHYSNFQIVGSTVNGGTMIHCQPHSNNDQHWFTDVFCQGGETYWMEVDVSDGACYNWTLKGCVMDGSQSASVYVHDSGTPVLGGDSGSVTDFWVDKCHASTRSGVGVHFSQNGDGTLWRNLQVTGGRYKFADSFGFYAHGTDINCGNAIVEGVSFTQDETTILDSDPTDDYLTSSGGNDGTGHEFSEGTEIQFRAAYAGLLANHTYTVRDIIDPLRFTVSNDGGATRVALSADTGSVVVQVPLNTACSNAFDNLRFENNHIGGFGGDATLCDHAIVGAGTPQYNVVIGNVAKGIQVSFSTGLTHATTIVDLNACNV